MIDTRAEIAEQIALTIEYLIEQGPYTEESLLRKGEIQFYEILARVQKKQQDRLEAQKANLKDLKQ